MRSGASCTPRATIAWLDEADALVASQSKPATGDGDSPDRTKGIP